MLTETIRVRITRLSAHQSSRGNPYFRLICQDTTSNGIYAFVLMLYSQETQEILDSIFGMDEDHCVLLEKLHSAMLDTESLSSTIQNRFIRNPYEIEMIQDSTEIPSCFKLKSIREAEDINEIEIIENCIL